ncbi:hypothetical protein BGZ47_002656 [Haplosporangium gracile]|nr:hypothetical protein BGZ47_002656 [Haplosporangium gracile]
MGIEPLYFGSDSFESYSDLNVHPFFLTNIVSSWTVEVFLGQHPSDFELYSSSLKSIESHRSVARSIRGFCFRQLKFLESVEGSTHVNFIQAQSRTSQNTILIKENCLDDLQRDIIAGQGAKLGNVHVSTVCSRAEAPSVKQPSRQETGNASQSKADNSGTEVSTSSTPTLTINKLRKNLCATEEPWHSLTISLIDMVNGKKDVSFPEQLPDMLPVHALLFDHAVESLKEYQNQGHQEKDIILVKDAQVAMSCVLNTMSKRACQHFEELKEEDLVETAKSLSVIDGFEKHECTIITRKYSSILVEKGVDYLRKRLIIDRGAIYKEHVDLEQLPANTELEDKVLQILVLLGEKALEASKIMRQRQAAEYSEVSESGRKVDCLFMYKGLEISNIEFKRPGSTERDLALQNRKNVRLARCIQEAHVALGVEDASVMMADVAGFVGIFYQVKPMGDIAIAGETTSTMVHLPRTAGGLESFLDDNSLAILWNFVAYLEKQGQKVLRAKERHDVTLEKAKLAKGVAMSSDTTHAASAKKFPNNVMLTPSKKRTWTGGIRIQISSDPLQDIRTRSPTSSPTEEP